MALTRQSITRGPGVLYLGSAALPIASQNGIDTDVAVKDFPIRLDQSGDIDRRVADVEGKISLVPDGRITAAMIAALYPSAFRNPVMGTSVFGATDSPSIVHSVAGQKVTFHATAITKMPQLMLSAQKTAYGSMEVTAIRGNGLEWTNAAALYTIAAAAYSAPNIPSAEILTQAYTAAWGSLIASIISEAGWTIDFNLNLVPDPIDAYGTNDYLISGVEVIARCRPKNLSETLINSLYVQDEGAGIGVSRRKASNLVITGGDLTVTLYDAILQRGPLRHAGVEVRAGEIAFIASRVESTGTYGAVFEIALAE